MSMVRPGTRPVATNQRKGAHTDRYERRKETCVDSSELSHASLVGMLTDEQLKDVIEGFDAVSRALDPNGTSSDPNLVKLRAIVQRLKLKPTPLAPPGNMSRG